MAYAVLPVHTRRATVHTVLIGLRCATAGKSRSAPVPARPDAIRSGCLKKGRRHRHRDQTVDIAVNVQPFAVMCWGREFGDKVNGLATIFRAGPSAGSARRPANPAATGVTVAGGSAPTVEIGSATQVPVQLVTSFDRHSPVWRTTRPWCHTPGLDDTSRLGYPERVRRHFQRKRGG